MNEPLVTIGDVAQIIMGQAPAKAHTNKNGNGVPFIKVGEFTDKRPVVREWTTNPLRMAEENDVLVCVVGSIGRVNLGIHAAIGRSVAAIRPSEKINQAYLYYLICYYTEKLRKSAQGTTQGVLTRENLMSLHVPQPDLQEQKRIVEILDANLSKLDSISNILNETHGKGNTLQRSILKHFLGDSSGSKVTTLGAHLETRKSKGIPSQEPNASYLGLEHVEAHSGRIIEFESARNYRSSSPIVEPGDVLYGRLRPYLNKVVIAPERLYVSGEFIVFKPSKSILSSYLQLLLMSPSFLAFTASLDTGDRPRVSWDKIANFEFSLPPLDQQENIVTAIEAALANYSRFKDEVGELKELGDNLRRSILHEAFTGQLTKEI